MLKSSRKCLIPEGNAYILKGILTYWSEVGGPAPPRTAHISSWACVGGGRIWIQGFSIRPFVRSFGFWSFCDFLSVTVIVSDFFYGAF